MSLKQSEVKVTIRGTSPILQNNPINIGKSGTTSVRGTVPNRELEAESTTYRDANGSLYMPSTAIFGCMLNAGNSIKVPKTRKTLGSLLKGATLGIRDVTGTPRMITLRDYNGNPLTQIDIFSARCVIQRASVIKHRAMINEWQLEFIVRYADEYLPDKAYMKEALERGGILVGIGDYRPDKKGEFGRFEVIEFGEV